MFKKDDILPAILAFITTVLIVTLGFSWLAKSKIGSLSLLTKSSDNTSQSNSASLSDVQATTTSAVQSDLTTAQVATSNTNNFQSEFSLPAIVPQGTSVAINGSANLNKINQILRKNFHQQYPGTVITTKGDGSTVGLDLLYSREIDLAALDRPLSKAEKEAGLKAISIFESQSKGDEPDSQMYYVYQEPLSPDTEAFLGYVFSRKGQQALENL